MKLEKTNCLDVSSELLLSAFCLAAVDLTIDKMMMLLTKIFT